MSDHTESTIVQLREEHIGSLEEGKSYSLQSFRIAEYDGEKYLAMCQDGSKIVISKDIVDAKKPVVVDSSIVEVNNPKIVAVYKLESFKACLRCQSRVEPRSPPFGRCIECGVLQNYDFCTASTIAQLVGGKMHSLQVSGELISKMAGAVLQQRMVF